MSIVGSKPSTQHKAHKFRITTQVGTEKNTHYFYTIRHARNWLRESAVADFAIELYDMINNTVLPLTRT